MYTSETYTLYRRHNQLLSQIHIRPIRAILGIRWSDRVTKNEVLQRADMPSIEAILLSGQLTWTGHVVRMNDDRLPKKGRRWRMTAVHVVRPSKKEPQTPKPKEQPMPKSNDNAAMNVRSRLHALASFRSIGMLACRYCGRKLAARIGQLSYVRACARKHTRH